jgi:hypothetical protein
MCQLVCGYVIAGHPGIVLGRGMQVDKPFFPLTRLSTM